MQGTETMPTAGEKVLVEKTGHVGRLTFNNPARHNAVSYEMWEAAVAGLKQFDADPEVRVVVVSGAGGKSFVSGGDISKFEDERAEMEAVRRYQVMTETAYATLLSVSKPTIAAIRGYCIGGGLGLAVSCDIRLCTEGSRFSVPAAKLGLGYGFNPLRRLSDVVGRAYASEIFYTARQFDAADAFRMGLVNRIAPDDAFDGLVEGFCDAIIQNAPLTNAAAKYSMIQLARDPGDRDLAGVAARVDACSASSDYREGRRAFMEKRKPDFSGS